MSFKRYPRATKRLVRYVKGNRNQRFQALIKQRFSPNLASGTDTKITKFRIDTIQSILELLISKNSILFDVHSCTSSPANLSPMLQGSIDFIPVDHG